MIYIGDKQKKLINSWHDLSNKSEDNYMAFMAEWVAFNAICYNLYFEKAVKERANIDSNKSHLKTIKNNLTESKKLIAKETIVTNNNDKLKVKIEFMESNLKFTISENYTEDIIFNEFVYGYENWYNEEGVNKTNELFKKLKESLEKNDGNKKRNYIINMAKIKVYNKKDDVNKMADRNIVVLCEENNLKTIKNVLYQIRCNIFHGEKTPGDIFDDNIVKRSLEILRFIVNKLIVQCRINTDI